MRRQSTHIVQTTTSSTSNVKSSRPSEGTLITYALYAAMAPALIVAWSIH